MSNGLKRLELHENKWAAVRAASRDERGGVKQGALLAAPSLHIAATRPIAPPVKHSRSQKMQTACLNQQLAGARVGG